jgi:hypothetical protein
MNGAEYEMDGYGRSAVSSSSRANGALGEQRRHDTDGMRLEVDTPMGCRLSVRRSTDPHSPHAGQEPAVWTHDGTAHPAESCSLRVLADPKGGGAGSLGATTNLGKALQVRGHCTKLAPPQKLTLTARPSPDF